VLHAYSLASLRHWKRETEINKLVIESLYFLNYMLRFKTNLSRLFVDVILYPILLSLSLPKPLKYTGISLHVKYVRSFSGVIIW